MKLEFEVSEEDLFYLTQGLICFEHSLKNEMDNLDELNADRKYKRSKQEYEKIIDSVKILSEKLGKYKDE